MKIPSLIMLAATLALIPAARSQDAPPALRTLAGSSGPAVDAASPGNKVLSFCTGNLGRKVGNGQCATLAVEALGYAGAAGKGKDSPRPGDYVWGKQAALIDAGRRGVSGLDELAHVRPGDIIQFRNVRLEGVNRAGGGTYWMSADHHTAVVVSADASTGAVTILHQNWGKMIVKQDTLFLADLRRGWLSIYRPQPAN